MENIQIAVSKMGKTKIRLQEKRREMKRKGGDGSHMRAEKVSIFKMLDIFL